MTNFTETYRPLRPKDFDRNAVFRAGRALPINGKLYKPGDEIDTTAFTTRRLRQMYEQRLLTMHDPVEDAEEQKARPLFEQMPTQAVIAWLRTRKKLPRRGAMRASIVATADAVWRKENGIAASESGQE